MVFVLNFSEAMFSTEIHEKEEKGGFCNVHVLHLKPTLQKENWGKQANH